MSRCIYLVAGKKIKINKLPWYTTKQSFGKLSFEITPSSAPNKNKNLGWSFSISPGELLYPTSRAPTWLATY